MSLLEAYNKLDKALKSKPEDYLGDKKYFEDDLLCPYCKEELSEIKLCDNDIVVDTGEFVCKECDSWFIMKGGKLI